MDRFPIHVILEDIRSAFNVGAFFRTSDAANITKLWLTGITPYPPHNRIPKTALGATETVAWEYRKEILPLLKELYQTRITPVAVELTPNAKLYTDFNYPSPVAIVFGNEITGVSKDVLNFCKNVVKIPMFGKKESLNVEVSYGIIVYEIIRQFTK